MSDSPKLKVHLKRWPRRSGMRKSSWSHGGEWRRCSPSIASQQPKFATTIQSEGSEGGAIMTTVTIGQASITRIEEMYTAGWDAPAFFPDWQAEAVEKHLSWMVPHHFDPTKNALKLSIHSWLLRIGRRTVLIDTCIGNHKERPSRPEWHRMETRYLARLGEAGVRPEEIDLVMCTHLHADHVGWNTRLDNGRWVPTFPNAHYVFSKADYQHYLAQERAGKEPNRGSFRDSVLPVVEAGLAQMVDGDETLDEHLTLERAPGHTPGSVLVKLASVGERA